MKYLSRQGRKRICIDFTAGAVAAAATAFGIVTAGHGGGPVDWVRFPLSALIGAWPACPPASSCSGCFASSPAAAS